MKMDVHGIVLYALIAAQEKDSLTCLKYAHENGCSWDKQTCSEASRDGHLECLKYAHENGCSWDAQTCSEASENGHLECLKVCA